MASRWLVVFGLMMMGIIGCMAEGQKLDQQQVTAGELVRAVRESENWIHKVDSMLLRTESHWSWTPAGSAGRRAAWRQEYLDRGLDPNQFTYQPPISRDRIEMIFEPNRLRYLTDDKIWPQEIVWDGRQLTVREPDFPGGEDIYVLKSTLDRSARSFFSHLSWLHSQPHSFWWEQIDTKEHMDIYGREGDFRITGRENYRGHDCYVLEAHLLELPNLITRWQVGVKDGFLYGQARIRDGKPSPEHWMDDYREVIPGGWFPMDQGYDMYAEDDKGDIYLEGTREIEIVELRFNRTLADELFQMELREGVRVQDLRSGEEVEYVYRMPTELLAGKALEEFCEIKIVTGAAQVPEKGILYCFMDMQQRPSMRYIKELIKKNPALAQKGVTVMAVQALPVENKEIKDWITQNNIPFLVGAIGNAEKTKFDWGIRGLPWLVLTNSENVIQTEGFGADEVEEIIKEIIKDLSYNIPSSSKISLNKAQKVNLGYILDKLASYQNFPISGRAFYQIDKQNKVYEEGGQQVSQCEYTFQGSCYKFVCEIIKPANLNFKAVYYFGGEETTIWYPAEKKADVRQGRVNVHIYKLERYSLNEILTKLLKHDIKIKTTDSIDGIPCLVLECVVSARDKIHVWVTTKPDIYPVKIERYDFDILRYLYRAENLKYWNNILYPEKIVHENYALDKMGELVLTSRETMNLKSFTPHIDIDPNEFRPDFPPGTSITARESPYILSPYSLVGRRFPGIKKIKADLIAEKIINKPILFCFFDLNQRSSRHCMTELAKKADELSKKHVIVVGVQASKVDSKVLKEWLTQNNISFPVGMIVGDEEKTKFDWGVKALPWLILTDKEHIVQEEGFGVEDMDKKIK